MPRHGVIKKEGDAKFPFEINDGNYDRTFERVSPGETVAAQYSMAIREDSYTGYYIGKMLEKAKKNKIGKKE